MEKPDNFVKTQLPARKVDKLGRITIPTQLRKECNIKTGDILQVQYTYKSITLSEKISCTFCGNNKFLTEFSEKYICERCIGQIMTISMK